MVTFNQDSLESLYRHKVKELQSLECEIAAALGSESYFLASLMVHQGLIEPDIEMSTKFDKAIELDSQIERIEWTLESRV